MPKIISCESDTHFKDVTELIDTCRQLGVPSTLNGMSGTTIKNGFKRHIADSDGSMNYLGRQVLSAAMARMYAEGYEFDCTLGKDDWKSTMKRAVSSAYNLITSPKIPDVNDTRIRYSGMSLEVQSKVLWRTSLLNSGIELYSGLENLDR